MQQYLTNQIETYFNPLKESSDSLPFPIAFVDRDFCQFWENRYLQENFPFLHGRENLLSLLKGYDIDKLIVSLSMQDHCISCPCLLPMSQLSFTFSPVYNEEKVLLGAVVHFSISSPQLFPSEITTTQNMIEHFDVTMRDPISSIFSALSTMARRLEVDDVESCEQLLTQLNHSCYHLLKSCNLLTEYSKYINGLATLDLRLVPLNSYLKDLFHHLQMLIRSSGVTFSYTLPQESIDINLDTDKFMIVLTSLISNSLAFMEDTLSQNKTVHLDVSVSLHSVRFVLSDNGVGISDDVLPHIFEPYFTSDRRDFQFSHLGLGLPLCQKIIQHHGGEISVFSQDTKGTTVNFTISRDLNKDSDEVVFCDNPIEYIQNSYSPLYVYLSDVCDWTYV